MIEVNKSVEYTFLEAWEKAIDNKKIIITSKNMIGSKSFKIPTEINKIAVEPLHM